MAIPTITQVDPVEGPASGYNIIEVTGTNFRIPTVVPAVPTEDAVPTVKVLVGTQEALAVRVLSSTLIHAVVPPDNRSAATASVAKDVSVQNIDDDGNDISGELATESSTYTYKPWKLGPDRKDPPMLKVTLEMIERLKREVTKTTSVHTHVDFADEGGGTLTQLSTIPCLGLKLSFPRDVEFAQWDNGFEEVADPSDPDRVLLFRGQRTHMIVAAVTAVGEGLRETMFLLDGVMDSIMDNPYVEVSADEDLYPGSQDQYLFEISGYPVQGGNQGNGKLVVCSMQIRVRGIRHISDYPTKVVWKMAEAYLTETNMEGENIQEVQLV
jgi:hypothetical protein